MVFPWAVRWHRGRPRPRLSLVKRDDLEVYLWPSDYWWLGRSRVIDGRPFNRGFDLGFGPFVLTAHWKE